MWTRYSDDQRASVLAMLDANGGNVLRTARETGVPASTIQTWRDNAKTQPDHELREQNRLTLAELIRAELDAIFEVMPSKRETADYKTLGTVAGILADKLALLDGGATGRIDVNLRNLPPLPEDTLDTVLAS